MWHLFIQSKFTKHPKLRWKQTKNSKKNLRSGHYISIYIHRVVVGLSKRVYSLPLVYFYTNGLLLCQWTICEFFIMVRIKHKWLFHFVYDCFDVIFAIVFLTIFFSFWKIYFWIVGKNSVPCLCLMEILPSLYTYGSTTQG